MGKTAQRRLQTSYNYVAVGIKPADNVAVNYNGAVRAFACFSACGVGVVMTSALCSGVVRQHAVDVARRHHKTEPRFAELCKISVVFPVRLSEKCDLAAAVFKHSRNYSRSERRVVDIAVARNVDKVGLSPAALLHFLGVHR